MAGTIAELKVAGKDFILPRSTTGRAFVAITCFKGINSSIEEMFDEDYIEIAGTNPLQHRTRILGWADSALPPFQEAFLAKDQRMVFAAMIDRNGYLPVHNKIYSHPQRPGDVAWNTANSRNRRIFNDPAGLAAGRNLRAYLVQTYARDMGNGKMVMMREIDVPIRVKGRHWGGFRTAYRL